MELDAAELAAKSPIEPEPEELTDDPEAVESTVFPTLPYLVRVMRRLDEAPERRRLDAALLELSVTHPVLARFHSVADLLERFHARPLDIELRDVVLVALIAENDHAPDSGAGSILLRNCLRMISGFARRRRAYYAEDEQDDLEPRCILAFTEAVRSAGALARTRTLLPYLRSQMKDRLEKEEGRDARERRTRVSLEDESQLELSESPVAEMAGPDAGSAAAAHRLLQELMPRRSLSDVDRELVIRVKALDEPLPDVARSLGLTPGTARQRLSRALRGISLRFSRASTRSSLSN